MKVDRNLYEKDFSTFDYLGENVNIYNLPDMLPAEIRKVLESPGTIIGGFCDSTSCLAPFQRSGG